MPFWIESQHAELVHFLLLSRGLILQEFLALLLFEPLHNFSIDGLCPQNFALGLDQIFGFPNLGLLTLDAAILQNGEEMYLFQGFRRVPAALDLDLARSDARLMKIASHLFQKLGFAAMFGFGFAKLALGKVFKDLPMLEHLLQGEAKLSDKLPQAFPRICCMRRKQPSKSVVSSTCCFKKSFTGSIRRIALSMRAFEPGL